jgi:hypothetical protein
MENIFMPIAPVYYMLVVIVTAAVLVNTVVGIFVENYYVAVQEREDREKREKHSAPLDARRSEDPFEDRFPTPKSGFRLRLFLLATDARFDCFIALSICVSTVIMSLERSGTLARKQMHNVCVLNCLRARPQILPFLCAWQLEASGVATGL